MTGMTSVSKARVWPTLDAALFVTALLIYASVVPLGLARVEAAPQVTAAIALDTSAGAAPLAVLAAHVARYLPLGDQPMRANLVSAIFCALAVALLGRLCVRILVLLRPSPNARQYEREFVHEPIAAAACALAAGLSFSTFDLATTGGTAAATLLLLAAGLGVGLTLLRDCTSPAAGWALAALAGLSTGVDAVAGPLLWPLFIGFSIWALRLRARWPLMAPLVFVAASGASALAGVACSDIPATLDGVFAGFGKVGAHLGSGLWLTTVELADEVGVIGGLLAMIGLVVLGVRGTLVAAWLMLVLLSSLLFARPSETSSGAMGLAAAALPLAIAVICTFAVAGLVHVAGRLGRARMAAVLALAVMVVLSPALDGGVGRWGRSALLPMRLLDHALGRVGPRSVVDPGTDEMEGLFRLAHAMGLRPDLVVSRAAGKPR